MAMVKVSSSGGMCVRRIDLAARMSSLIFSRVPAWWRRRTEEGEGSQRRRRMPAKEAAWAGLRALRGGDGSVGCEGNEVSVVGGVEDDG